MVAKFQNVCSMSTWYVSTFNPHIHTNPLAIYDSYVTGSPISNVTSAAMSMHLDLVYHAMCGAKFLRSPELSSQHCFVNLVIQWARLTPSANCVACSPHPHTNQEKSLPRMWINLSDLRKLIKSISFEISWFLSRISNGVNQLWQICD